MTAPAVAADLIVDVFDATARASGFPSMELRLGKGGARPLAWWRARAVYVCVARGCSFEEIGFSMERAPSGVRQLALKIRTQLANPKSYEQPGLDQIERELDSPRQLPPGVIDFETAARRVRARRRRAG